MSLHLIKMAVGVADIAELGRMRAARTAERGGSWVPTRHRPRHAAAIVAGGGSLYWVIRGQIRMRQRITGFGSGVDDGGRPCCRIEVDPELVSTALAARRPFQGWRYLSAADAPPDVARDRAGGAVGEAARALRPGGRLGCRRCSGGAGAGG